MAYLFVARLGTSLPFQAISWPAPSFMCSASGAEATPEGESCSEGFGSVGHSVPCEKPTQVPGSVASNIPTLLSPPDPETVFTKDDPCESIMVTMESLPLRGTGQYEPQSAALGAEEELPGEDSTEDPAGPHEGSVSWKQNTAPTRGATDGADKPSPFAKPDSECSSQKPLSSVEDHQEMLDGVQNFAELPPSGDSSVTRLDAAALSSKDDSRPRGSSTDKQEEKAQSPPKERVCTSKKLDKEHHRPKRERVESEEREGGRSQLDGHCYKRRRSYSRERTKPEHYKREYYNGNSYRPVCSPDPGRRNLGKYPPYHFRSRGNAEPERSRYCYGRGDQSWSRGRYYYYDTPRKWEKCRSYHYYYSHISRNSQDRKFSHGERDCTKSSHVYNHPYNKDYCNYKSRWSHDSATKKEKYSVGASKVDSYHIPAPAQCSSRHPDERFSALPEDTTLHPVASCLKSETLKEKKRKCPSPAGSNPESKHRLTSHEDLLDEQRGRKHKKAKKKKKAKNKHRERESRSVRQGSEGDGGLLSLELDALVVLWLVGEGKSFFL